MEPHRSTTPFGRRPLTLGHVASQMAAKTRPPEKAVHKWTVFRAICAAKARVGVSERALAVLDALLTFHPETALTGQDLVVFPSNQQLCLRAHGMAPATLRRHLAALVDKGLIVRRDSPNGKRYARKDRNGDIELAFGFDLAPLVVRADEFEAWAEETRAQDRALKLARERITLCRRDIAKMIATGKEEAVSTRCDETGPADWTEVSMLYRDIVARIPRRATLHDLEPIADAMSRLAQDIFILMENHVKIQNMNANESQSERHIQNSKPDIFIDLEPDLQKSGGVEPQIKPEPAAIPPKKPMASYPLGMVLDACPDIVDYARGGIANWRDFLATAAMVRAMLGISPSAWQAAQAAMGEPQAAVVVAALLQRGSAINSPGGYIRGLTQKAQAGQFAIGPMLMALVKHKKYAINEKITT